MTMSREVPLPQHGDMESAGFVVSFQRERISWVSFNILQQLFGNIWKMEIHVAKDTFMMTLTHWLQRGWEPHSRGHHAATRHTRYHRPWLWQNSNRVSCSKVLKQQKESHFQNFRKWKSPWKFLKMGWRVQSKIFSFWPSLSWLEWDENNRTTLCILTFLYSSTHYLDSSQWIEPPLVSL